MSAHSSSAGRAVLAWLVPWHGQLQLAFPHPDKVFMIVCPVLNTPNPAAHFHTWFQSPCHILLTPSQYYHQRDCAVHQVRQQQKKYIAWLFLKSEGLFRRQQLHRRAVAIPSLSSLPFSQNQQTWDHFSKAFMP